jgi:5'(3')-deoxyribonucleotidase
MMNNKYRVFIDMDGVVSDMDAMMNDITNGESRKPDFPKGKYWAAVTRYNNEVAPFFASLPKMPEADKLVQFITDNFEQVAFLTATGTTPKDGADQKRGWLAKNYPGMKVITVVNSAEKAIYANPRAILVDDRDKSIGPWRKAGGIGILFTSTDQAIGELEPFLG